MLRKRWISLFLVATLLTQTASVHPHNCWWPTGRMVLGIVTMVASAATNNVYGFFLGMMATAAATSEYAACREAGGTL